MRAARAAPLLQPRQLRGQQHPPAAHVRPAQRRAQRLPRHKGGPAPPRAPRRSQLAPSPPTTPPPLTR